MTKNERVRRVALLCCHCARNVAYYRAWWDGKELVTNDDFFRNANSNAVDIAVLEWCKLFSDPGGKHKWCKVVPEPDQFMPELYAQLAIDKNFFDEHCEKTKTYRDKFLAHLDEERCMHIPDLTIVLKSVIFLYGILQNEYGALLNNLPTELGQYYKDCFTHGKRHATDQQS